MQSPNSKYNLASQVLDQSWFTMNDCDSGCLYGDDYILSSGSLGITTFVQNCQHTKYVLSQIIIDCILIYYMNI